MKVELYQRIERVIVCEAIRGLFADDFKIPVSGGEQTTFEHGTDAAAIKVVMFTTGEDQSHVEHQHIAGKDWVLFIYGSDGHDVIVDHTTSSELSLKDASELADKTAGEDPAILACALAEVGTQRF